MASTTFLPYWRNSPYSDSSKSKRTLKAMQRQQQELAQGILPPHLDPNSVHATPTTLENAYPNGTMMAAPNDLANSSSNAQISPYGGYGDYRTASPLNTNIPAFPQHRPTSAASGTTTPTAGAGNVFPIPTSPQVITDWGPALQFVMKLGRSKAFARKIKAIVDRQTEFEKAWHERLKQTMEYQSSGKQPPKEQLWSQSPAIFAQEMYRRCLDLEKLAEQELRAFEIPFFCIDRGLVADGTAAASGFVPVYATRKVDEKELAELKLRMLEYLRVAYQGDYRQIHS
ncbi:hypothetical protein K402DRAFT_420456 [Aulographum hederae CBS 113979]|uniref:Uncharacterized protein n=1 Tax=Aulographum hederae CBS 113979 TaxID=1176131 RepID=A0A6G1H1Z8_9PEZI|nr:hypothetical protein K402DRAFT_420456 [Aulographum hederae CBS 113979]